MFAFVYAAMCSSHFPHLHILSSHASHLLSPLPFPYPLYLGHALPCLTSSHSHGAYLDLDSARCSYTLQITVPTYVSGCVPLTSVSVQEVSSPSPQRSPMREDAHLPVSPTHKKGSKLFTKPVNLPYEVAMF